MQPKGLRRQPTCYGIFFCALTNSRVYYRALSSASAEKGVSLLSQTSKLARFELFEHPVQERILTSDVDYVTLGWTRILQATLDLIPPEKMDDLLPR